MKGLECIWIFLVIIFFGYIGMVLFDEKDKNQLYIATQVKCDCDYNLPKYYSLVQDSVTGEYAIQYRVYSSQKFLSLHRYIFVSNFISKFGDSEEATVFRDSCKAKGFTREYFESLEREKKFIKVK